MLRSRPWRSIEFEFCVAFVECKEYEGVESDVRMWSIAILFSSLTRGATMIPLTKRSFGWLTAVFGGVALYFIFFQAGEASIEEGTPNKFANASDNGPTSLKPTTKPNLTSPRRNYDPNVRPTSALLSSRLLAATTTTSATGFRVTRVSQVVGGVELSWQVEGEADVVRLLTAGVVTVEGSDSAITNMKVKINNNPISQPSFTATSSGWSVPLTISTPGENAVEITNDVGDKTFSFTLVVPTQDDLELREPTVSKISNNAYADPGAIQTPIRTYGGFLRIDGRGLLQNTRLQFAVFKKDASGNAGQFLTLVDPSRPTVPNPEGTWLVELDMQLPSLIAGDIGYLFPLASAANRNLHRYGVTPIQFKVASTDQNQRVNIAAAPQLKNEDNSAVLKKSQDNKSFISNSRTFFVTGGVEDADSEILQDSRVVVFRNGNALDIRNLKIETANGKRWKDARVVVDSDSSYDVQVASVLGRSLFGDKSLIARIQIRTKGPKVEDVNATDAALSGVKITFDAPIELPADLDKAFVLQDRENKNQPIKVDTTAPAPTLDRSDNSLTLKYKDVPPNIYNFTVKATEIKDVFGNQMAEDHEEQLFRSIGAEEPITSRGVTGPTGSYVPFPEYNKPRPPTNGANPSDHVETRVARLYYYRDAHRVAQIINRDVKSYNRAAVKMQEQLADKARQIADQATDDRRSKERRAVEAARKTREAERELQEAEANAQRAAAQAANAATDLRRRDLALRNPDLTQAQRDELEASTSDLRSQIGRLEAVATSARGRAESAKEKVQALRDEESELTEDWQRSIAVEDRAREAQFRREVAAANTDPDTYVPGRPSSIDPVRQVSVSVIGEGVIQLRGPIKGINIIRAMINQIDSPVGQVRVGVHTVQINGEHGDRMEKVAEKIQRYIDHSRFLTMQSAEMLRKAIVQVAAQKAIEVGPTPGLSQMERDRRYLYAFFGEDFVRELEVMDSEFLKTGNKLLSIHSMDSTSLASALFIMALAKNSTRLQILAEFERMMREELPMAEHNYFEAGLTSDGKKRLFGKHRKSEEFQMLSENARFQSIRGFFDAEVALDHTMTPIQREFVRLAQIFKSRLIVEMELKQRIMERTVIEERLGDHLKELQEARDKEKNANDKLRKAEDAIRNAQKDTILAVRALQAQAAQARENAINAAKEAREASQVVSKVASTMILAVEESLKETFSKERIEITDDQASEMTKAMEEVRKTLENPPGDKSLGTVIKELVNKLRKQVGLPELDSIVLAQVRWPHADGTVPDKTNARIDIDKSGELTVTGIRTDPITKMRIDPTAQAEQRLGEVVPIAKKIRKQLEGFQLNEEDTNKLKKGDRLLELIEAKRSEQFRNLLRLRDALNLYEEVAGDAAKKVGAIVDEMNGLAVAMSSTAPDFQQLYRQWLALLRDVQDLLIDASNVQSAMKEAQDSFQALLGSNVDYQFAVRDAEASRRSLDHKKFLDMLVDEMEDKYIELLEGTRAHTANIDAYIKRLVTSLDDDFNTQFYYPAFRHVRRASQLYDVQMGQVETTNILANNRSFAKVSPQATMEFDLPKRDIVITEAINGAKATIDDIGALAADPTFLAMTQLKAGSPTSTQFGGAAGGFSTVRNVLPGLSTDTAENVMSQQGPGGSQFGAALESLIPDPAIYKFETGTGYEIRPVIQPDGQAVVFDFDYMYTTNIREPVRADEKHLGRVKRHFVHTDVQLSNFELREVSRYTVALKASRTSRGVPLLEDIPVVGILFRPLPSDESSLQQNVILSQATIFPTLFDLMGLRWAPAVADLDPLRLSNDEFVVRNRRRALMNRVFDHSSSQVDKFLRIPQGERRMDLYRSQETLPYVHPNGYRGPGVNLRDSHMREGYSPTTRPPTEFAPGSSNEGDPNNSLRRQRTLNRNEPQIVPPGNPEVIPPGNLNDQSSRWPISPTSARRAHHAAAPRYVPPAKRPRKEAIESQRSSQQSSRRTQRTVDPNVRPAGYVPRTGHAPPSGYRRPAKRTMAEPARLPSRTSSPRPTTQQNRPPNYSASNRTYRQTNRRYYPTTNQKYSPTTDRR